MKSLVQGSQSTTPVKFALQGPQSTAPATISEYERTLASAFASTLSGPAVGMWTVD